MISRTRCTGCTACASVCPTGCISMIPDDGGFFYPEVTDASLCIHCGACERVCPVLSPPEKSSTPKAYAAYTLNDDTRAQSSSGGIFTELAQVVLANGGVVYGAAYDEAFRVVHIRVEDPDALSRIRGAKYAQSDLSGIFSDIKERLKEGTQVLFSGTPCQVAGLKSFLGHDQHNLICVDFVCHGVPSPMAWERYVAHMGRSTPILSINLRSKETGWSRYRYSNLFIFEDGTRSLLPSNSSLYMRLFVGDYINRYACKGCRFKGVSRASDLTLGDFWGIWDVDPDMDDDRGTSAILVHTPKGAELWDRIADQIKQADASIVHIVRSNPSVITSSEASRHREVVLRNLRAGNFSFCEELLKKDVPTRFQFLLRRIRKAIRLLFRNG